MSMIVLTPRPSSPIITPDGTVIAGFSNGILVAVAAENGVWSWEETVYSALAGKAAIHLDNTPFWDMGTPERLALLERFLKETAP